MKTMIKTIITLWLILILPVLLLAGGNSNVKVPTSKVESAVAQLNNLIENQRRNISDGITEKNSYIFYLEEGINEVTVSVLKENDYIVIEKLKENENFPLNGYDLTDLRGELKSFNEDQTGAINPNKQMVYVLLTSGLQTYSYVDIEGGATDKIIENLGKGVNSSAGYAEKAIAQFKELQNNHTALVNKIAKSKALDVGNGFLVALSKYRVYKELNKKIIRQARILGHTYAYGDYANNIHSDLTSNVPSFFAQHKATKNVGESLYNSTTGLLKYLKEGDSLCPAGKSYYDDYISIASSEQEKSYLRKVAELICQAGTEELIVAQAAQYRKYESRAKSISEIIAGNPFSFEAYYNSLLTLKTWADQGLSKLPESASDEQKEQTRELFFDIAYKLDPKVIGLLSLDRKVEMLTTMMDGKLYNMFTKNHDELVVNVVKSIKDYEAKDFLDILTDAEYKNSDNEPLIYVLKSKLSDFLNGADAYTAFFKELKRLTDARSQFSGSNLEIQAHLKWDVEQKEFVIISYVKNRNEYVVKYDINTHTVDASTCLEYGGSYKDGRYCKDTKHLLEGASPFDLVGLIIENDVSPFGAGCENGAGTNEFCGKEQIVPAIFLDYLTVKENSQRLENFGWNTFNVVITISTFGEGAAAISAIRAADTGRKLYVASKNAYALLDFTYNVADISLKAANVDMPKAWVWVGYAFAAKSSYDLLRNGGAKGIGHMSKKIEDGNTADIEKIIDELNITSDGSKITVDEFKNFIQKAEIEINNSSNAALKKQYNDAKNGLFKIQGITWNDAIGKKISELEDAPLGYQFYKRGNKEWIRRLDANNADTPRLTIDENGFIVEFKYASNTVLGSLFTKLADLPHLKSWVDNLDNSSLISKLNNLDVDALKILEADVVDDGLDVLKNTFEDSPDFVDGWSILKNSELRADVGWLTKVNIFKKSGYEFVKEGVEIKMFYQGDVVAKISDNTLQIKIPYADGWARQSSSELGTEMLGKVAQRKRVYRLGTLDKSQAGEAQFWSPENPYNYSSIWDYANKYGIPEENLLGDNVFFEVAIFDEGVPLITREAPGIGDNFGGAIEVVVPPSSLKVEVFSTVSFNK